MSDSDFKFTCLFCDDVRLEVGNKLTIVGIYAGTMQFEKGVSFPLGVPKLAVVSQMSFPVSKRPSDVLFRFEVGNPGSYETIAENLLSEQDISALISSFPDFESDELNPSREASIRGTLIFPPLQFAEPCFIRATAVIDGRQHLVGRMRVLVEA